MFSESSSILQQRMPQYYLGQNFLILWVWVLFFKKTKQKKKQEACGM